MPGYVEGFRARARFPPGLRGGAARWGKGFDFRFFFPPTKPETDVGHGPAETASRAWGSVVIPRPTWIGAGVRSSP
jgi:hypothetical protein